MIECVEDLPEANKQNRAIPEIICEEDVPISNGSLVGLSSLNDKDWDRNFNLWKHLTAKTFVLASIAGVCVMVMLDFKPPMSGLHKDAFEFFKLLALTTTGYLFGTNKAT